MNKIIKIGDLNNFEHILKKEKYRLEFTNIMYVKDLLKKSDTYNANTSLWL